MLSWFVPNQCPHSCLCLSLRFNDSGCFWSWIYASCSMNVFHNNVMNDDLRLLFLDSIAGLLTEQEFKNCPKWVFGDIRVLGNFWGGWSAAPVDKTGIQTNPQNSFFVILMCFVCKKLQRRVFGNVRGLGDFRGCWIAAPPGQSRSSEHPQIRFLVRFVFRVI